VALLTLLSAVPAAAEPAGADLAVTVAFDKPAYLAYERMTATVTVVNNGTAPATGVTLSHESNGPFDPKEWFGLDPSGPGVTIEPGQQVAASATIEMQDVVDVLRLAVEVHTPTQETDTTNNAATAEAPVTVRRTDLNGTLYRDIDGDKQFDPGEALGGVLIEGVGGRPRPVHRAERGGGHVRAHPQPARRLVARRDLDGRGARRRPRAVHPRSAGLLGAA
jgi:hypothetical protein